MKKKIDLSIPSLKENLLAVLAAEQSCMASPTTTRKTKSIFMVWKFRRGFLEIYSVYFFLVIKNCFFCIYVYISWIFAKTMSTAYYLIFSRPFFYSSPSLSFRSNLLNNSKTPSTVDRLLYQKHLVRRCAAKCRWVNEHVGKYGCRWAGDMSSLQV